MTPTYLSALEHGRRGQPNWGFVQRVIQYFNVIWDDAEELQRLAEVSHPRIVDRHGGTIAAGDAARQQGRPRHRRAHGCRHPDLCPARPDARAQAVTPNP